MSMQISSGWRLFRFLALAAALLVPISLQAQTPAASPSAKPDAAQTPVTVPPAAPPAGQSVSQTSGVPGTQNPAAAAPGAAAPGAAALGATAAQTAGAPGTASPADQSAAAPANMAGLCQCIGNVKDLDFRCQQSADSCQSQCGARYSFVPAAQCTATAH
jgi:hypothetical protein